MPSTVLCLALNRKPLRPLTTLFSAARENRKRVRIMSSATYLLTAI